MISKNLDRGTRDILLIFQFGYLGVILLYLGLILWAIENGSLGPSIPLGSIEFPISRQFLVIMMSLFLLVILTPYISGWKRASRWNVALLEKERYWLDELLDVLEYPASGHYVSRLQKVLKEMKDDDTSYGLDKEFDQFDSLYGGADLRLDPRFRYMNFLRRLQDRITKNIDQFGELKGNKEEIKETARLYAGAYRLRRDEIVGMIEKEGKFRPNFWIALAIILTPVIGQILASLINGILMGEPNLGGLIMSPIASPLP